MAEILIKAEDGFHSRLNGPGRVDHQPVEDRRGCFKRGDIVAIMPDGHQWGAREGLPKFVRVRIPGLQKKDVQHLLEPERDIMNPEDISRQRVWALDLAALPPGLLRGIETTGEITIPYGQIRSQIRNKATGETA